MARPRKHQEDRRRKWPVLNVTPAERAAIERAARDAGLGINAYLLACTRQTRLVRGTERARMVRHLARADAHLEAIACSVVAAPLAAQEAAGLLLALRRIELLLQKDLPAEEADVDVDGEVDARPC